jgi:hypothetical protein
MDGRQDIGYALTLAARDINRGTTLDETLTAIVDVAQAALRAVGEGLKAQLAVRLYLDDGGTLGASTSTPPRPRTSTLRPCTWLSCLPHMPPSTGANRGRPHLPRDAPSGNRGGYLTDCGRSRSSAPPRQ